MKRGDHDPADSEGEKKKKKKRHSHGDDDHAERKEKKKKHKKKHIVKVKEEPTSLVEELKKAFAPIPSIKTPEPLLPSPPHAPVPHAPPPTDWLKEQEIFHNFVPQSVEAHIMFLHLATTALCGEMNGLADGVTMPLRNYRSAAEKLVSEAHSKRNLPEAEVLVELLSLARVMHTDMAGFIKGMDRCTRALLALHNSVQELATKSRARMRNITAHTFNSYIFGANTPGSSLLTVPSVPQ